LGSNVVDEDFSSSGIESRHQQLRELDSVSGLPLIRNNELEVYAADLAFSVEAVFENGFAIFTTSRHGSVLGNQPFMEFLSFLGFVDTTKGPRQAPDKDSFVLITAEISILGNHRHKDTSKEVEQVGDLDNRGNLNHGVLELLLFEINDLEVLEVLVKEGSELFDFFSSVENLSSLQKPSSVDWFIANVTGGDEDDTTTRDGSGRGVVEVFDFEDHLTVLTHRNTITGSEGQNLVIIQDSVEVFNPNGIDGSIANNPSVDLLLLIIGLAPDFRENTGNPIIRDFTLNTVHFLGSDSLRVHSLDLSWDLDF